MPLLPGNTDAEVAIPQTRKDWKCYGFVIPLCLRVFEELDVEIKDTFKGIQGHSYTHICDQHLLDVS